MKRPHRRVSSSRTTGPIMLQGISVTPNGNFSPNSVRAFFCPLLTILCQSRHQPVDKVPGPENPVRPLNQ